VALPKVIGAFYFLLSKGACGAFDGPKADE